MKTISISERINFKLLLNPRAFDFDTEMLNGKRYLKGSKRDLIKKICHTSIDGSEITLIDIEFSDIDRAITILNI